MNTIKSETVNVFILDKEYRVTCPSDEKAALEKAASYLDDKMNEIKASGKVLGLERIAVMAALNITHDLLQKREKDKAYGTKKKVQTLADKVDKALKKASNA